jgi:hypothetical protein
MTWVFLLLILGIALNSLALVFARTARRQSQALTTARYLAVVCLVVMVLVVPNVPFALSFFWPFLSSTIAYGVYLAAAGLVSALIGLATLSNAYASERRRQ